MKRQKDENEQLLNLLDRELAEGFPNPNRIGCPDSEILQRLARHQIPIPEIDAWIDHLGSCSECFADFNRRRRTSRARWPRVILYGVAASIVFASAGLLWRQLSRGRKMSSPVAGAPAIPPAVVAVDRPQALANTGADRNPFEVALNLTQSATRGKNRANDRPMVRVQARLLKCHITLPFGSAEGLYHVQIQRAAQGEVLKAAQGNATINNGDVRLDVELDLSNLSAGGYSLSYRHAGESWHHVPIVITNLTD
jgi:hypothetical protein